MLLTLTPPRVPPKGSRGPGAAFIDTHPIMPMVLMPAKAFGSSGKRLRPPRTMYLGGRDEGVRSMSRMTSYWRLF